MAINLLPQVTAKEVQKSDTSLRGLIIVAVWVGILLSVFVLLYFNQAVERTQLKEATAAQQVILNKISAFGTQHDDYYTLAYKTRVLENIRTKQYIPSAIGDYIKEYIEDRGKVTQYYFDASGSIQLSIFAPNYDVAVHIWHDLLKDRTVITELNLTSFSRSESGVVTYSLEGKLNLQALYERNGIK